MHEISLCENVVRIIEKQAEKDKFSRVVSVTLAVGAWSGASPEALSFCFPLVAKGTLAEGAKLVFKDAPGQTLRVTAMEVG